MKKPVPRTLLQVTLIKRLGSSAVSISLYHSVTLDYIGKSQVLFKLMYSIYTEIATHAFTQEDYVRIQQIQRKIYYKP